MSASELQQNNPRYVEVKLGIPFVVRVNDALCREIDVESYRVGIPTEVCVKGFFVNQLASYVAAVRPEVAAEFTRRHPEQFPALEDVSLRATLRRGADAAQLAHPDLPLAEALRRMGRAAYMNVLKTLTGRVMFAILGRNIEEIYNKGPRAYEAFERNGSRVTYTRLGDRHFRYDYTPCYNWIDSYQIGVVEGVALACGKIPVTTVHLKSLYQGSLECRW